MSPKRLIVLAPIEPGPGNGLAMRTELFRRSAPAGLSVLTVVVPVAGRLSGDSPAPGVALVPAGPALARAGVGALLGDPAWRERLTRAGALPRLARAASPGLAEAVMQVCGGGEVALHVMRAYLAPLGIAVAERLGAAWVTLDLDEDDAAFARERGDDGDAAAYERLLTVFGPLFDGLSAAAVPDAQAIARRHELAVEHVPNAVDAPDRCELRREGGGRRDLLLFVGNLTYAPNVEAATALVEAILPRLERRLGRTIRVQLVGRHHPDLNRLAGAAVELTGFVPDLRSVYEAADAVVVPLRTGGGTRIKLLEAFAHGVPVVASPVAAAGLEVSNGRELLLAEDHDQAAAAIERILTQPVLAARLVAQARRLVRDRYDADVVVPQVREFFARAAIRSCDRAQLPALP